MNKNLNALDYFLWLQVRNNLLLFFNQFNQKIITKGLRKALSFQECSEKTRDDIIRKFVKYKADETGLDKIDKKSLEKMGFTVNIFISFLKFDFYIFLTIRILILSKQFCPQQKVFLHLSIVLRF